MSGRMSAIERDYLAAEEQMIADLQAEKYAEPGGPDLHENEAAVWSIHGPVCLLPLAQRNALRAIRDADRDRNTTVANPIRLQPRPTVTHRRDAA